MSLPSTLLLGFIAGVTILLGLPIGRLRTPAPKLSAVLNATAIGVLLFLVWDVLSAAWGPIDEALSSVHTGKGGLGAAVGYGVLFAAGLAVGLLSLVYYESWMARQSVRAKAEQRGAARPGGLHPAARLQAALGPWAPALSKLDARAGWPPGPPPADSRC